MFSLNYLYFRTWEKIHVITYFILYLFIIKQNVFLSSDKPKNTYIKPSDAMQLLPSKNKGKKNNFYIGQ